MKDNNKHAIEVATRRLVTGIAIETIETVSLSGQGGQIKGMKKAIMNMMQISLTATVETDRLDTILIQNVTELDKSPCFMDALTR